MQPRRTFGRYSYLPQTDLWFVFTEALQREENVTKAGWIFLVQR